VIDFRVYRVAFAPALAAVVILLFSLEGIPQPISAPVPRTSFDGGLAATTARQVATEAPSRAPGSDGDARAADLVAKRFGKVEGGEVSEQRFQGTFEGDEVELRNVILTLPGESDRTIVVMAPRDSANVPGAASSAAATATLLELADDYEGTGHTKTLVFVSTDGASEGAAGAREFAESYAQRDLIDATVVISQPGSATPHQPFVIPYSSGKTSASIQLERTIERLVAVQTETKVPSYGFFGQLSRLAIPSGLGEQAVLIEDGRDAIALSAAGERPLAGADDQVDDLSGHTLGEFGNAALSIVVGLDAATAPPAHGPSTYLVVGGDLLPGWSLTLLALTLLLPPAAVTLDGLARSARRRKAPREAVRWAASLALPPLGALAVLYLMALVGIVPSPSFPFDPARYALGARAAIATIVLVGALAGGYWLWWTRARNRYPWPADEATPPAIGAVLVAAGFTMWLGNPYLALLLVPAAHAWLTATRPPGLGRAALVIAAVAVALIPALAAVENVSDRLDLGASTPWTFLVMVADGQIPLIVSLSACVLAGGLAALCVAGLRRPAEAESADLARSAFPATQTEIEGLDPRRTRVPDPAELDISPIPSQPVEDDLGNEA
jgi:hypothetical protein